MKPDTPEEEHRRREQLCAEIRRNLGIAEEVETIGIVENGRDVVIGVRVLRTGDTHYVEPIPIDDELE